MKILIENATVIKDAETPPFKGNILINNDRIEQIGENVSTVNTDKIIDATEMIAVPGFIQTHVHLAQTIFRNMAEDISLLNWLNRYILPFESQHTEKTLYDSARLGIAELLLSGTTTIQDMETVLYTDSSFKAVKEMGIRASMGNMLMDTGSNLLAKDIDFLMTESEMLYKKWNNRGNGKIKYVLTPR
ncbi:MAG: amidohydrolase family protein, partial [Proteobacteria bacterium]|nr:amidohydrolase family protein [Pseudomonadota bacterium]